MKPLRPQRYAARINRIEYKGAEWILSMFIVIIQKPRGSHESGPLWILSSSSHWLGSFAKDIFIQSF